MNNYFSGFASTGVTLPCRDTLKAGDAVTLLADGTAAAGDEGTSFMGVCSNVRKGYATVILKGYAELKYTGSQPIIGYNNLICDAGGTVSLNDDVGDKTKVVFVDTTENIVGIIL